MGRDKSADMYKYVDDKWSFTRSYIEEAAEHSNFELIAIAAHDRGPNPFRTYVTCELMPFAPAGSALPEWAWSYIDEIDGNLSTDLKREIQFTGTIVLRKC